MKDRKGIILAGGKGTRLFPATLVMSKQLIPVYDKPMIYYPIATLMQMGIRNITVITTPHDYQNFVTLLGSGSQFGVNFSYAIQCKPNGLAQAYQLAKHTHQSLTCMILGDNLFYGDKFDEVFYSANRDFKNSILAYKVDDPRRYGVVEFDKNKNVISLEEKPQTPKSSYAIPGVYFLDDTAHERSRELKPSQRGELEIVDLLKTYMNENILTCKVVDRGSVWLDTGTHNSLIDASQFVHVIERRQGIKIACLEEIAYNKNWITKDILQKTIEKYGQSEYSSYLQKVILEKDG